MCGKTTTDLLARLRARQEEVNARGTARSFHVPEPVEYVGGRPVWDSVRFFLWGMRMGWVKLSGRAVIGYTGMQVLFDLDSEQTARKWALQDGFPPAVQSIGGFALFDKEEVIEFGMQSGRLTPAGAAHRLRDRRT